MILVAEAEFKEASVFGKSGGLSRAGWEARWLSGKGPRRILSSDRGQKALWIKKEDEVPAFSLN